MVDLPLDLRSRVIEYAPEHRPGIHALWQRHFGHWVADRFAQRWDWQFESNPFAKLRPPKIFVAVAESTGQMVGVVTTNPIPLRFEHQTVITLVGNGLAVDEPYRGRCMELVRRFVKSSPAIAGGLHPSLRAIMQHLGFEFVPGSAHRFALWLRHDGSRARRLRRHLRKSVTWLATPRLAGLLPHDLFEQGLPKTTRLPRATRKADIRPFDRFGADYDALWTRVSAHIPCTIERSAAYMNWRHVDCPTQTSIRLALFENDQLRAVAVGANRVEMDWTDTPCVTHGEVTDIIADDPTSPGVEALTIALLRALDQKRCDSITALGLHPSLHPLLKKLGFTDGTDEEFAMAINPRSEPTHLVTNMSEHQWYISAADSDALYAATI